MDRTSIIGVFHAGNRLPARDAADVYRHIVDAIIDQRLPPGAKLGEEAMAEVFGLSRRAIAPALDRLTWDGLAASPRNRGTFVAVPSADEARDVLQAREAIEAGVVAAACRVRAPVWRPLWDIVEQEAACRQEGRLREAVRLSGGFHLVLAELAGNGVLHDQVRTLVARTSLIVSLYDNPGGLTCWHDEHRALIRHIEARHVVPAVTLMRRHLRGLAASLDLERRPPGALDVRDLFRTDRRRG